MRGSIGVVLLTVMSWTGCAFAGQARTPGVMAGSHVTRGAGAIAEVWLTQPTVRYRHFVLGRRHEAGGLAVRLSDGRTLTLTLDDRAVFEDSRPRLADLDGDGNDEIVVVKSYLAGGAALAVYGVKEGRIAAVAETPDMGHPNGWLNPAGIADFDGDGRLEIAFVRKPHILGQLELWRLERGKLVKLGSWSGFSNHAAGSPHIGVSAVADFDGDGTVDLALPSFDRRSIRLVTFKGAMREIRRHPLPAAASGDFTLTRNDGKTAIRVPLANGAAIVVVP